MRLLLLLLAVMLSCKAVPQTLSLSDIASREIGKDAIIEMNISKTYALVHKSELGSTSYAVIQVSDNKVILRKVKIRAEVTWGDDFQIKEIYRPEIVRKGETGNTIVLINIKDYLVQPK